MAKAAMWNPCVRQEGSSEWVWWGWRLQGKGVTWKTGQGPETLLPVPHPRSMYVILTHDFIQHQVKTAAEGSVETHCHRDGHVTQSFSQTAAVDIILCQDV